MYRGPADAVEGGSMSGYGVPGIPGRSSGTDRSSARLDEEKLEEAAHRHEMTEKAKAPKKPGFFARLFGRRSSS
jgi:hypothetical protein